MKPKTMILMAVAIVCGLGASYMTSRLLAERDDAPTAAPPPPEPERVKLLVAKANLDHGAALKNPQDMFVEKQFNKEDAPKDGLTEVKTLKGKYLRRALRKGDHITVDDLMDERTSILASLPDGYQAYGIQVDAALNAYGWAAQPGSKVNIIWMVKGPDNKKTFAKVLLEDVLVLAADDINKTPEDYKAKPVSVVIVALKTVDTLKVKLAQSYGPLTLTLRKFGDTTPLPEKEMFGGDDLFVLKGTKKDKGYPNTSEVPPETSEGGDPSVIPMILPDKKTDEPKKIDEPNKVDPKIETPNKVDPKIETPNKVDPKIETPNKVDPKIETPNKVDPKIETPNKVDPKTVVPMIEDPKTEDPKAVEPPPAPKRYFHTVNFRQGDKQWRQVIEVDAKGRPIQDDVQQEADEQQSPQLSGQQPVPNRVPNYNKKVKK